MVDINSIIDTLYGATSQALVFDEQAWDDRRERLQQIPQPRRRMAKMAIHDFSRICPETVKKIMTHGYERNGFEVLGIGKTSTVIRIGETATKIIRKTASLDNNGRDEEVKRLNFSQRILLKHMPDHALEQQFEIIDHPLRSRAVVAAKQPLAEGFVPIEISNRGAISNLCQKQRAAINRFTNEALCMVEETGWVPDLIGASNIGFTDGSSEVVLVDTIPLYSDGCHEVVMNRLEKMAVESSQVSYF